MGYFINANSAWIMGLLVLAIAAMLAWDYRRNRRALALIVVVLIVLGFGYGTSRTGGSDASSLAEFDAVLAAGSPVVMELYSDTCIRCLFAKRDVDAMEADLAGRAVVLRVDSTRHVGSEVARRYGLTSLPSFVVFDADGIEVYRESGSPDTERLKNEALPSG